MVCWFQEQAVQQMQAQQARLDGLQWLLADARRLIGAVSAVEGHTPTKTALQVGGLSCSPCLAWPESGR